MNERLRQARMSAGFSSASAVARRLGISPSTYIAHENGQNEFKIDAAQVYGRLFKVSPNWLLFGTKDDPASAPADVAYMPMLPVTKPPGTVPVYGAPGYADDGFFMPKQPIDYISAPADMAEIPGVYAVYMSGDSMSPRFEHGEALIVNPKKPAKPGDYVVLQVEHAEGIKCIVRRFSEASRGVLTFEAINPPEKQELRSEGLKSLHKIIGITGI